jgi:hypothetical protein
MASVSPTRHSGSDCLTAVRSKAGPSKPTGGSHARKSRACRTGCNDVDAVLPWYDRLLGRPADARPTDILAEYHLPRGVIQLVANADRAGRSLLTLDFAGPRC